ncbi:hypothetical protein [Dactylosporangium sp. NPDC049140]|uniref:hypothetical protein n=1 Tax=Dactylosporangium sp. NPDC049140 TaxID=3155647 RepID=UPI0033F19348
MSTQRISVYGALTAPADRLAMAYRRTPADARVLVALLLDLLCETRNRCDGGEALLVLDALRRFAGPEVADAARDYTMATGMFRLFGGDCR